MMMSAWRLLAQPGEVAYATPSKSIFANLPNIPDCVKTAVEHGDPSQGPSVLLLKFEPGCTIPGHWHTAAETLILVKGAGTMQMEDGKPVSAGPGDFVYLPAKHVHQFRSNTAVLLYDLPDGPFDIHYVDPSGKEISFGDAIRQVMKVKPAAGPTTSVPQ
jgi:quercetin dioxygenase-like cupin family protein